MITTYKPAPDIDVLTTNFPIPGLGQLAINSFVLHGDVPVLVDTGPVVERESFMTALKSVIDPVDLRWIWLTHTDGDHIGALEAVAIISPARSRGGRIGQSAQEKSTVGGPYESFSDNRVPFIVNL